MKWARLVLWEYLGQKGREETLGAQEFLLQDFLEKKVPQVPQDPQGKLDHLALQVPQEELLRVTFWTQVCLETRDLLALMVQEEHPGLRDPLGVLTFLKGNRVTVVCQGLQVHQVHQALQDAEASQDVMAKMARKDPWDSQDHQGPLELLGHLETRVYLDLQADQGPWVLQVPEVNLDHLQMWMPALESRGFPGYQAQEGQKDPWGSLDREVLPDQSAKESLGRMAGGVKMASQGPRGLQDTKVTWEKQAAQEHQVLLGP